MVEAQVETDDGFAGLGAAPTGTSVGSHESFVLRDGDPAEYGGMGVRRAVANVNEKLAPALVGMDVSDQAAIDRCMIELDATPDKHVLGGNAIYSVSIAALRAAGAAVGQEVYRHMLGRGPRTVPVPTFNVINGGKYGDMTQPFNEFLVVPWKAGSVSESVEMGVKIFAALEEAVGKASGRGAAVGRSYGWVAPSDDPDVCIGLLEKTCEGLGYGGRVAFALDCASSEMYDKATGTYLLGGKRVEREALIEFAAGLARKYPMLFIEDLLDEDDFAGYALARLAIRGSARTLVIGDDLIVSDRARLEKAHALGGVDGFILKPNQIGTISEAMETHAYAVKEGLLSITSGRSGGVVDDIVMDLAVATEIPFIKNGAPRSGERINKLNFLMRVQDVCPDVRLSDLGGYLR
jgi:enolase